MKREEPMWSMSLFVFAECARKQKRIHSVCKLARLTESTAVRKDQKKRIGLDGNDSQYIYE